MPCTLHFIMLHTLSSNEVPVLINVGVCRLQGEGGEDALEGYCQAEMSKGYVEICIIEELHKGIKV